MTASSYEACLARLLLHEGGYTNHPADPGGPTNFGITIYDYRRYVKPNATAADVRAMQVAEAKRIYRAKYWDAQRCDELPAGVDHCVFDYGVNSGIGRSKKVLQRVVGVTADGVLGAVTLQALAAREPAALIDALCDERLRFLKSLKTWGVFGKGWGIRVAEVRTFALLLAASAGSAAPASPPMPKPQIEVQSAGKGVVPLHPALKAVRKGAGPAGAVAGGGTAVGTVQNETAWQWFSQHPAEVAALVVVGVALVGGTVYLIDRWHRSQQEAPTPGRMPVPAKEAA